MEQGLAQCKQDREKGWVKKRERERGGEGEGESERERILN